MNINSLTNQRVSLSELDPSLGVEELNIKDLDELKKFYEALESLKTATENRIKLLEEKQKSLIELREKVRLEWEKLNQEKRRMVEVGSQQQQQIKLNVGGTMFVTSLDTLLRTRDSMLSAMFSGKYNLKKDENGAYFIDRDGTYFRYILNFLRDGCIVLPEDKTVKLELLNEARYFQISGLIDFIERGEKRVKVKHAMEFELGNGEWNGITLSEDNQTAISTNGNFKTVLTKQGFSSGKHYWEIQVNFGYNSIFFFMVGVASEVIDTSQALHSTSHSWCYRSDGTKSPPASGSKYGAPFSTNEVIGILLEFLENGTVFSLKFFKNGTDQGYAFTSVPNQNSNKLYPAISLNNMGDKCTIVKYVCHTPNEKSGSTIK